MKRPNRAALQQLLRDPNTPAETKAKVEALLAEYERTVEQNPLESLAPHSAPQRQFFEATTPIQAAFAGNRFGKTTALIAKCLIQHCPEPLLPSHLAPYRATPHGRPIMGRLLIPSEKALIEYTIPAFKEWCPKGMFLGGTWDKAWDKQHNILRFAGDCGQIGIYTYKQDPATMVGAKLDYVAYDEPPPESHRNESLIRLVDRDGFEMFAMTPVNMTGGGIGWIYRKIWKRRESADVTVVKASIHDNPLLGRKAIERILAEYPEEERAAREKGDFLHFGGMVYAGGLEDCLVDPPSPERVKDLDVIVGIDPGLKNAAFVWVGFDNDNRALVFDELLLQERTPRDYANAIRAFNKKWGLSDPLYVIDPSARNRSLTEAESVESELQRLGIYTMHGQNNVQAGVQQVRGRMQKGALKISRDCRGLRSEADEYRMEDRPDGEFKVVKENDHRLDAMRYAVMTRAWDPLMQSESPQDVLGWTPGEALSHAELDELIQAPVSPLGFMS